MAALDFPNSPTVGQLYNGTNGVTYEWDGTVWKVPLGGAQLWSVSGSNLTPTDATKTLALPGPASVSADTVTLLIGSQTIKSRFIQPPTVQWNAITANAKWNGTTYTQDDASKASWIVSMNPVGDGYFIQRVPPGGSYTSLLVLDAAGALTLTSDVILPRFKLSASAAGASVQMQGNYAAAPSYDNTRTSWGAVLNYGTDQFELWRSPAGVQSFANMVAVTGGGNLTISGATATKASGTTWANPSDERMKRNVEDYGTGLDAITQLRPVCFKYNGELGSIDTDILCYGYIAQEVEQVMPECVGEMQWTPPSLTQEGVETKPAPVTIKTLDQSNILLALVNAVKELATRVAALEK